MFLSNIIFLPLLGSFFTGFGGKIIGRKGSVILSNFCIFSNGEVAERLKALVC